MKNKRELTNSEEVSISLVQKKIKNATQSFFKTNDIKNDQENLLTPEGSTSYSSSFCLAQDTWKEIFSYLNPIEVARIARTCKFFNELNDRKTNGKCYMIVGIPKGVTSPEDFMEKIRAYKESTNMLLYFSRRLTPTVFQTEQEARQEASYGSFQGKSCFVQINLPLPYVRYLIEESGVDTWGAKRHKLQIWIKIIDSMQTPKLISLFSHLNAMGLYYELEKKEGIDKQAKTVSNAS